MENIKVGDILIDRDTRRVGRTLKVLWVDSETITAEVVSDALNSKKSSIGNSTDISRSRLKKGYTLAENVSLPTVNIGNLVGDSKEVTGSILSGEAWRESNGFSEESSELVNDTNDLEDALNSAGYFWLPPVNVLVDSIKEEAENVSKTGLVHLIHGIIKDGLINS